MLHWTQDPHTQDGIRRRIFSPQHEGGLPSGIVYEPEGLALDEAVPVVCMQHGGSSAKDGPDVLDAATAFTRLGCRVLALDGPVHGARAATPMEPAATRDRFLALWREDATHVAQHVDRWQAVLQEVQAVWPTAALRWLGVSMGTAYGLPLLARGTAIDRAVLGMWGACYPNSERLLADAAALRCAVLFQQKWDDELFSRQGQLALFDALGTPDKRLHVYPGGHVRIAGEQWDDLQRFLLVPAGD
ncbi:hypothetical protein PGB34_09565 [Xenophilus arseniciresistens]|uniref:Alpha/beta hydrolase n=1 Tax=Xenophilus arseniciresistens TaxID=1283306 RepID=A0AAE3N641_9BURK|nr:hypothetical protein [Xenophilus arseniciresistens]MDA7416610.1 hypothetical protein [Xenophilus arseniciresistens]